MVFSSLVFLYLFLPLTLAVYFAAPQKVRNHILLLASLFFYAWGELGYVLLMVLSIIINWLAGLGIAAKQDAGKNAKSVLAIAIGLNLLPLIYFKYGNFLVDSLNTITQKLGLSPVELDALHLPIGISFFTFQAISYLIDIYRGDAEVQRKPANLALYIALFPQLIAGPIVRYKDIAKEISGRVHRLDDVYSGTLRFITGLGKKVLIANPLGAVADQIFILPIDQVSTGLAWVGIITYSLQIYFDFSAYSDMAIGLGRIFGFHFLENFNYPYISRSIQEFWRRWHISLSNWFRDYLYIPLGGNQRGSMRTYLNLLIVFFLCGLWHGASWAFVVWGLYHGGFLILERLGLSKLLARAPVFLQHAYVLLVVMIGWVFFRSETLGYALDYIARLFSFTSIPYLNAELFAVMSPVFYMALIAGLLLSTPVVRNLFLALDQYLLSRSSKNISLLVTKGVGLSLFVSIIVLTSTAQLLTSGYNPFLYFRF